MKTPLIHWPLQLSTTGDVVCTQCSVTLVRVGEVFTPNDLRDRTKSHRRTCEGRPLVRPDLGPPPREPRGNLVPRDSVEPPGRPNPGRP